MPGRMAGNPAHRGVVQLVERLTLDQEVEGSSPSTPTKLSGEVVSHLALDQEFEVRSLGELCGSVV